MYDALQTGFAYCGVSAGSYLTWINSDDILMPGALSCVARLFCDFPDIQWLGGIPCQIDEDGAITRIHDQRIYPPSTLAAGLHDGRHLPFVMQEGAFWRAELWLRTGGLRTSLRLAGDFDLWRRFAIETSYVSVETVLGAHRRHAGQLTEDSAAYYAELDALMQAYAQKRDREWERYQQWQARSAFDRDQSFLGTLLTCETGRWALEQRSLPTLFNTTICLSDKGAGRSVPAQYVSGFSEETHQYPHINVPRGSRLPKESIGVIHFEALTDGPHRLRVRLRTFSDRVALRINHGSREIFQRTLPLTRHDRDCEISVDTDFKKGMNKVEFISEYLQPGESPKFLITVCEAAPVP
jgi:hypothetical protein